MDIATKKLHDAIHEYLDDVHGRSHMPVSTEFVEHLQGVADSIQRGEDEDRQELSPGQREAARASEGIYREAASEPEDSLSPGQREAQALSIGN